MGAFTPPVSIGFAVLARRRVAGVAGGYSVTPGAGAGKIVASWSDARGDVRGDTRAGAIDSAIFGASDAEAVWVAGCVEWR